MSTQAVHINPHGADAATSVAALRTKGLSVHFGGLVALSNVEIAVEQGQIVSVIGPNGAGKSTLLNAINGLIRSTGEVGLFGQDVSSVDPCQLCGRGLARTFQDPQLMDNESVLENVLVGGHASLGYNLADQVFRPWIVRARERSATQKAIELLDMVGLAGVAHRKCNELSYGAHKLIDIVRAMLSEPSLLLLDEPSSGLDMQERRNVEKLLLQLNAAKRLSMLVVEHHMDLVRAVSHQVVALQSGAVLLTGTPSEVLESQGFRKAMIGGA